MQADVVTTAIDPIEARPVDETNIVCGERRRIETGTTEHRNGSITVARRDRLGPRETSSYGHETAMRSPLAEGPVALDRSRPASRMGPTLRPAHAAEIMGRGMHTSADESPTWAIASGMEIPDRERMTVIVLTPVPLVRRRTT